VKNGATWPLTAERASFLEGEKLQNLGFEAKFLTKFAFDI